MKKTRLIVGLAALLVVLGGLYALLRPAPAPELEVPPKVWSFAFTDLSHVVIELPDRGLKEAWVKGPDKQFYFDEPDGPQVAHDRWGGGVPVILSGPRASRTIATDVSADDLKIYGLADPAMKLTLTTDGGDTYRIDVGDLTPSGDAHYFRLEDSRDIYTIDYTWYDVLKRLVTEPPYPASSETN